MRLALHGNPLVGRDYAISAEYRSELLRKSLKMECPGMAENPFFSPNGKTRFIALIPPYKGSPFFV